MLRQPIVTMVGHVDHGKTSILDRIRGSATAAREAGGITQAIGASIIPAESLRKVCGDLLAKLKIQLTLPGLLFIDTPGHAAFTNLRKRGGNLADIAILVVDLNDGVMPQTKESIEILKSYKTPFVVAANKLDLVPGWKRLPSLFQGMKEQDYKTLGIFEEKLYSVVGGINEFGLNADRFDRVSDYTKQVAIVPVSAATGEGIPELLAVLTGLAQRFLEQKLRTSEGPAKGTILEVKEQKGLGTVLDTIVFDGELKAGDTIVVGGLDEPIVTRVKAMFEPTALKEMRERQTAFKSTKSVRASVGVRIVAPGVETAVAGMPVLAVGEGMSEDDAKREVQASVGEVTRATSEDGIVVKADSLGSLEALLVLLQEHEIPVMKASIGPITKKDIADAEAAGEENPMHGVVLGFNVPHAESENVKVFTSQVVYTLIDDYEEFVARQKESIRKAEMAALVSPVKIMLLPGYTFRQSNPAVMGVEVVSGTLKTHTPLMNQNGETLTQVKGLQLEQKNIEQAGKNARCAVSMPGVVVGRQVKEGDVLYSAIPEDDFRKYKELKEHLSADEREILKEVAQIMRERNPVWGV